MVGGVTSIYFLSFLWVFILSCSTHSLHQPTNHSSRPTTARRDAPIVLYCICIYLSIFLYIYKPSAGKPTGESASDGLCCGPAVARQPANQTPPRPLTAGLCVHVGTQGPSECRHIPNEPPSLRRPLSPSPPLPTAIGSLLHISTIHKHTHTHTHTHTHIYPP